MPGRRRGAGSMAPTKNWSAGCVPWAVCGSGSPPAVPWRRAAPGWPARSRRPAWFEFGIGRLIVTIGIGTGAGDHVVQDADHESGRDEERHYGGDEDDVFHVGLLRTSPACTLRCPGR